MPRTTQILLVAALAAAVAADALTPEPARADNGGLSAETTAAAGVTDDSATLQARVRADEPSSYHFMYGPTSAYGSTTATQTISRVGEVQAVSVRVQGLKPNTTYRYRVVAWRSDSNETTSGDEQSFTTAAAPAPAGSSAPSTSAPVGALPAVLAPVAAPGVTPAARPVLGRSVAVAPLSGAVQVRLPGARDFVALGAGGSVPVGAVLDTRRGEVQLTTSLGAGHTQTGRFRGAVFQVRQSRTGRGMTDIVLRGGDFTACSQRSPRAGAAAQRRRRPPVRRLWAQDRGGRFRTHGRNSVATVRGTRWVTTDTCAGTRTTVTSGAVAVRDLGRRRTVLVRAGRSYLAAGRR